MKKIDNYILILTMLMLSTSALAQKRLPIYQTQETLTIDGLLDEDTWQNTKEVADSFYINYPNDNDYAKSKTTVKMTYNDEYLYIGAVCYDVIEGDYVIQTLKRDFEFRYNDGFYLFLDAFKNGTTGLGFGVNPLGVQKDGLIINGGRKGLEESWDTKWFAETTNHQNYWVAEIAIPLSSLYYKAELETWGINFARIDLKRNENSSWTPITRGLSITNLAQIGDLVWDKPLSKKSKNISVIPYVANTISKDYTSSEDLTDIRPNVGLDAKISITSSLRLDLTINPDFSQVDVDRQIINLSRFEPNFPERRLFFIENDQLFSELGTSRVSPFFSRRIGSAGNNPVPILFGAKLTGNLNEKWELGALTAQTEGVPEDTIKGIESVKSQNYSVLTLQRSLKKGTVARGFVTHRQAFIDYSLDKKDYNLNAGIEFQYISDNSYVTFESYLHRATTQEKLKEGWAAGAKIRFEDKTRSIFLGVDHVGENYIADMGFVPRLYYTTDLDSIIRIGYKQIRTNGHYRFFWDESNVIDYFSPTYHFDVWLGDDFEYQEHAAEITFKTVFLNTSEIEIAYENNSLVLFYPFTLTGLDAPFQAGNYPVNFWTLSYDFGKRGKINGDFEIGYGDKYLGKRWSFQGEVNYRVYPWGSFGLNITQENLFDFPSEFGQSNLTLVGTTVELSFSKNLFLTSFVQYNTQSNNVNVNARFQWRFQPMSDLYIVYTENYLPDNFSIKNRALAVKLNYWFSY